MDMEKEMAVLKIIQGVIPVAELVIRVCSVTLEHTKHKQKGGKCGIIGAREIVKTARKACTYGGGANV